MKTFRMTILLFAVISLFSCKKENPKTASLANYQGQENFTVIYGSNPVGYLKANTVGDTVSIDYDYKNNGRGPTIQEKIVLDKNGFPLQWDILASTTFGNIINEKYGFDGSVARWTDATGSGEEPLDAPKWYYNQSGSPYSLILLFRNIIQSPDYTMPILPGGTLKLTEMEKFTYPSDSISLTITTYALSGADTHPTYFATDENNRLFAYMSPTFVIVREGFEKDEKNLRELAENYSSQRFEKLQQDFAHKYDKNVRIINVRIFDPYTLSLSELSSVLIEGERIKAIEATDARSRDEIVIDGKGGTLMAGLYEMHAHTGDESAFLSLLAGITSFRDMGNDNEVLSGLIEKINSGQLAGPRIHRLGFIEGKSPFNANNGIIVSSEEEAVAAVETYHNKGFYGVKLYNSMNGDWAPAIVKRAHELDMFVCGHVPAFSNADAMLNAGFDEMTHINQTMLGWVLEPHEDTRTLLRLTALKRLPDLDLKSQKVQETLNLFVKNKVGIDPTLVIHEVLLLSRNGGPWSGATDFINHMPLNAQRKYKTALSKIESPEDDRSYRLAYVKIVETLKIMKSMGILIIPGTDMGGSFLYHRELELYQELGFTPAEIIKLATFDMARYMGDNDLGSIEVGKLADFFLVPENPLKDFKAIKKVALVSKGGTFYYPTEIYPAFDIKPFVEMPIISE